MKSGAAIGLVSALALLAVFVPPAVSAHADYLSSNPGEGEDVPSAPSSVEITFTEPVRPDSATIRVTNATGGRFDEGPATLSEDRRTATVSLAPAGPGVYTVAWVVQSAVDGHSTAGSFGFVVLNPDGTSPGNAPGRSAGTTVSPTEVVLRFLGFLGLALGLGAAVLGALIWVPAGRDPDALATSAYRPSLRTVLHWGRVGAFAYGIGMAGLWFQVVGLDGNMSSDALLGSPFLLSVLGRGILAIAIFFVVSKAFARSAQGGPEETGAPLRVALVLALAAIAFGSVGTHAAADTSLGPVGIVANAAHLAGAALWVGGLAGIVLVRRFLRDPAATPLARHVYARFSRLAGYSVALVLGGGTVLALLLVESVEGLAGTPYGWVVLAKLGLFAPMLGVGAFNRYRLVPGLAEADAPGAVRTLTRNVRVESTIGASVLVLAALLTAMVPAASLVAPSGPAGPFSLESPAGDLRVRMQVYPDPAGPGAYHFVFLLYNGTSRAPFDALEHNTTGRMTLTLVNGTLPPTTADLEGPHFPNHFFVNDVALSQAGTWRIEVTFSRSDAPDVRATFHVPIPAGG